MRVPFLWLLLLSTTPCHATSLSDCQLTDEVGAPEQVVDICTDVLNDPNLSNDMRGQIYAHVGVAQRNLGNLEESRDLLTQSQELRPRDASNLRMLAWTYRELGVLAKAEQLLTESLEIETHWQGFLSRCVVRQDQDRYRAALGDCEKVMSLDADNTDAIFFLARAYNALGRHREANAIATQGFDLTDRDGRIFAQAAAAQTALGLPLDAIATLRTGLNHYPNDADLMQMLGAAE